MHENMLWCFPNPPTGVYHICRLVTCHSRLMTLQPLLQFITPAAPWPGSVTFFSTLLLLLVSSYIYQKCLFCHQSSVSFLSCALFSQLISVRIRNSVIRARHTRRPPPTQTHQHWLVHWSWYWKTRPTTFFFFTINTHYLFTNKVVIIEINTK